MTTMMTDMKLLGKVKVVVTIDQKLETNATIDCFLVNEYDILIPVPVSLT
jgi:hypothetical protein